MAEKYICRCCLAHGPFNDSSNSVKIQIETRLYLDMLRDCFNIDLASSHKSTICGACADDVEACFKFKKKVLSTELEFVSKYMTDGGECKPEIKEECALSDVDDDSDDYFLADADNKKPKLEQTKARNAEKTRDDTPLKEAKHATNSKAVKLKIPPDRGASAVLKHRPVQKRTKKQTEKQKQAHNLETILMFTNATVFKNKTLLGYQCGHCATPFPDPAELRAHAETHKKEKFVNDCEQSTKVDITDLRCSLCDGSFDNLSTLKTHLVTDHGKIVYNDVKDHVIQFKLKPGEVYDCALCSSTYETFKMLTQHMNLHYSNYKCKKCESCFATRRSLNAHQNVHLKGSYECAKCEKVFSSNMKRQYHERMRHLGARNISNCVYCNVPFRSYYQRNQHMTKVHNTESQYKCKVCDKSYLLKSLLMCHIKKNHLMERNIQCSECGFKFFSKKALKAHMVKHTGERNFSCSVCNKSYARKYTLKEHMRIHNNDRRFKCGVCELAFVQKCSLKSHLLSNHGISVPANEITVS